MANEFKIKNGLILGPSSSQPVTAIQDSSLFLYDPSSLATVNAIKTYSETNFPTYPYVDGSLRLWSFDTDSSIIYPTDTSLFQSNIRLTQGGYIEAPAYDSTGGESNGYIKMMWLNSDNNIIFGSTIELLDSINMGTNPGIVPLANMDVDYQSDSGERHGITLSANYSPILSAMVESDGAGGYNQVGTVLSGPLVQTNNDVTVPAGSWRQRIVDENLIVEKFNGVDWVEITAYIPVQQAPVAYDLEITTNGSYNTGDGLTATYTYYDINGDLESSTGFQWYRADDATGTNKTILSGEDASLFTVTAAEDGYYITCDITPGASTGILDGSTYTSPYVGPCTNV